MDALKNIYQKKGDNAMLKIAHIINPVNVKETSDLFLAQPVTFETMRRAKASVKSESVAVELYYTCYEEDMSVVPEGFVSAGLMEKSILDCGRFARERKLPLLKEILDRLNDTSDADYFIYTNVDIALMPNFYDKVAEIIREGYDGFVINRRTISNRYTSVSQLDEMYADIGEKHPGYDCFVFKKRAYANFNLGNACIGANWIGRVLIANVIANAERFKVFEDEHLTFHIGDDRSWKISAFEDYDRHNEAIVIDLLKTYIGQGQDAVKPLLPLFIKQHKVFELMQLELVKQHRVHRELPDTPERLFGEVYRGSMVWKHPILLRQDPIFVVGYPRSGTTLLQTLIATQKEIFSLPEVHFFSSVRQKLKTKHDRIDPECMPAVVETVRRKLYFSTNAEAHLTQLAEKGELSPKMLYEAIVVDNVMEKNTLDELKRFRWMEKTPDNVLFLEIIFRYYPDAKVVNIIRNPEKAILSRRKHFDGESGWPIDVHVQKWINSIEAAEKCAAEHPGRLLSIRLEDLVADKEKTMERVCRHVGIKFEAQRLERSASLSDAYIMPWEKWKADVSKDVSGSIMQKQDGCLRREELETLWNMAQKPLNQYGYEDAIFTEEIRNALQKQKHQNALMANTACETGVNTDMSPLMEQLKVLTSISVKRTPLKKLKAYKALLSTYHQLKER